MIKLFTNLFNEFCFYLSLILVEILVFLRNLLLLFHCLKHSEFLSLLKVNIRDRINREDYYKNNQELQDPISKLTYTNNYR